MLTFITSMLLYLEVGGGWLFDVVMQFPSPSFPLLSIDAVEEETTQIFAFYCVNFDAPSALQPIPRQEDEARTLV